MSSASAVATKSTPQAIKCLCTKYRAAGRFQWAFELKESGFSRTRSKLFNVCVNNRNEKIRWRRRLQYLHKITKTKKIKMLSQNCVFINSRLNLKKISQEQKEIGRAMYLRRYCVQTFKLYIANCDEIGSFWNITKQSFRNGCCNTTRVCSYCQSLFIRLTFLFSSI